MSAHSTLKGIQSRLVYKSGKTNSLTISLTNIPIFVPKQYSILTFLGKHFHYLIKPEIHFSEHSS